MRRFAVSTLLIGALAMPVMAEDASTGPTPPTTTQAAPAAQVTSAPASAAPAPEAAAVKEQAPAPVSSNPVSEAQSEAAALKGVSTPEAKAPEEIPQAENKAKEAKKPAKKTNKVKAVSKTQAVSNSPFSDLKEDHWAYQSIKSLYDTGIVKPDAGSKFRGNEKLNRYEAAALLKNAIDYMQKNTMDVKTLETINALLTELSIEMKALGVKVDANHAAIDSLKKELADGRGVQIGRLKILGQAMFSMVMGGSESVYSNAAANNSVTAIAGSREEVTEFINDYMALGFVADIDRHTTFHTRANIYTGGQANTALGTPANGGTGSIAFDESMYITLKEWCDRHFVMHLGRFYLPWGHETEGEMATNPFFVSNSLIDDLHSRLITGAYFSKAEKNGWDWGLGLHNGDLQSPDANNAHLYVHTPLLQGRNFPLAANAFMPVMPFDTGGVNGANNNADDTFGYLAHAGHKNKSGTLNMDLNYFDNGGKSSTTAVALAGYGQHNYINFGVDWKPNQDWLVSSEYVDGSAEVSTLAGGQAAGRLGLPAGKLMVDDDYTSWYVQAAYSLDPKSNLAARYQNHSTDRTGVRPAVGNTGTYDDEFDAWTLAWSRKLSQNGSVIVEFSALDYDMLNGLTKPQMAWAGGKIRDDFDTLKASYRMDF